MNTFMANPDKIERKWYVVDAEGCTLGRLASEVAKVLRGKNKPEYTCLLYTSPSPRDASRGLGDVYKRQARRYW